MIKHIIDVPKYLTLETTIQFVNTFKSFREPKDYIFNFASLIIIDPFSILFLSSELEYFKRNNKESTFKAMNFEHCTYAGHMGFFKSFGLNFGKLPGEASGKSGYIPLRIFKVSEIKNEAKELMITLQN